MTKLLNNSFIKGKGKLYLSLLTRDSETSKWRVQFGTYDQDEMDYEYGFEYSSTPRRLKKVICTMDDQSSIQYTVDAMNGELIQR